MFPIAELPMLPMLLIIKKMENQEQLKLALTSKKMERSIKSANIRVSWCEVHVRDELSCIVIDDENVILPCGTAEINADSKLTNLELSKWLNPQLSVIENMANVFTRVRDLFKFENFEIVLDMRYTKKTSLKKVLSIPAFRNHAKLSFFKGKIYSEDLKYIMETENSDVHFSTVDLNIPITFKSENAFKFKEIEYEPAHWVEIQDLFALQNSTHVTLGQSMLNSYDINELLKHWINSKCDMFESLVISKNIHINFENLFDGLVVLCTTWDNHPLYFIAAKNNKSRENDILLIYLDDDNVTMDAWSKNSEVGNDSNDGNITHEKEFEILKLLERRKELRKEWMVAEKSRDIEAEIQELDTKLKTLKVYYDVNGFPTID